VSLSRKQLDLRRAYWNDDAHPRVAAVRRDLAVRLVRSGDDSVLHEAHTMAASAYATLAHANGPQDNSTLNALSARGFAARAYGELLRRQGDHERARQLFTAALDDAQTVLEVRRRLWPRRDHLVSQERYAAALAAAGEPSGIDRLRALLDERVRIRKQEGLAEVRWLAGELHAALQRVGRHIEASEVRAKYL
jgi:hypothetical protein